MNPNEAAEAFAEEWLSKTERPNPWRELAGDVVAALHRVHATDANALDTPSAFVDGALAMLEQDLAEGADARTAERFAEALEREGLSKEATPLIEYARTIERERHFVLGEAKQGRAKLQEVPATLKQRYGAREETPRGTGWRVWLPGQTSADGTSRNLEKAYPRDAAADVAQAAERWSRDTDPHGYLGFCSHFAPRSANCPVDSVKCTVLDESNGAKHTMQVERISKTRYKAHSLPE